MSEPVLRLADWTHHPAGRFRSDGPYSGEQWRDDFLIPAMERVESAGGSTLQLDLSGIRGAGSSFLEEVFGGLVRTRPQLDAVVRLEFVNREHTEDVGDYRNDAIMRRLQGEEL